MHLVLARDNASVENHFSGLIDDVTLYDTLLSSDHISALDENNRTPDVIPEPEVQQAETTVEQTGTENEYGFKTADENPSDQKIEEVAAEGYKVKKPEETKKKDKAENQASEKAKEALEKNPSSADQSSEETTDETIEEATDETIEEATDETIEEATDETIEEATDETIETTLDESDTVTEFDDITDVVQILLPQLIPKHTNTSNQGTSSP